MFHDTLVPCAERRNINMKKLMDVCDIQYGYAFDSKKFSNDSSFIPLIRIRDVKRGYSETFYSSSSSSSS